jgi:hypothetical protein
VLTISSRLLFAVEFSNEEIAGSVTSRLSNPNQ